MIIKFPKSFISWKNHVYYALYFRVSVAANLYKSGAKLGIWFIFWVCKNIYKHKILLTHSILSPYGLLPRPPIMIYLKMIQEKAPIHELVIFVSRQWWDKRNFPPQIKVNNGVPTTFISCTYLDDAAGIKLGNIKEREAANHLLIWHRKSIIKGKTVRPAFWPQKIRQSLMNITGFG